MLLMNCADAAASEAEDAVEFMYTGDRGWAGAGFSNVIALKDCKTSYTLGPDPNVLVLGHVGGSWMVDWNKVIWNSASFSYEERSHGVYQGFGVQCKEACQFLQGHQEGASAIIIWFYTDADRFRNALTALHSECPGVTTRF